jgi:transcription elongation factor Elf1
VKAQTDLPREDRPPRENRGRSSRNQPAQFACPRCHRVVVALQRVSLSNVIAFLECSLCDRCVDELRGLTSDLELVEVLA